MIKILTFTIWLLVVHVIALLAIFDTDLMYRIDRKLGTGLLTPPEITGFYDEMLGSHLQLDSSVSQGSVIFLGDSITQGLNVAAFKKPSINYGIGMDTSLGLLRRIPQYQSLNKASVIIIAIGINDLIRTRRSHSDIINHYRQILDALPNDTAVMMQSVFPVDEREGMAGLNQRINTLNQYLQALAKRRKLPIIDLYSKITDADGNLKQALHVGDGVHLSAEGYAIWIDALKLYLESHH